MTQTNGYVDPVEMEKINQAIGRANEQSETRMLLQTIGRFVGAQVKPLQAEIARLKARVAELEEGGVKFCGSYQRANGYRRGQWVGFDGSGWVALSDVAPLEQPGTSDKWQLVIRAGRDARDASRLPTRGGSRGAPEDRRP
jgi:hypothetical protein